MARVLEARGSDGAVCISDGTPGCLDNPLAHLPNVFFHSSLSYLSVRQIVDLTVSMPAGGGRAVSYTLFAHGLGAVPLVAGLIYTTGQPVVGSTVTYMDSVMTMRAVTLGADATNVFLWENAIEVRTTLPAQSLPLRVFVFDQVFP